MFVHHAVDDHSRLAYSTILTNEQGDRGRVWQRARTFFADAGITVTAVMTDNGPCYRSRDFAATLGPEVKHRRTGPRPTARSVKTWLGAAPGPV